MRRRTIWALCFLFYGGILFSQERTPVKDMRISKSVKFKKGSYKLVSPGTERPVIIIEGNHIIVDFNQADFSGSANSQEPDNFTGVFVLVRNSKNVTIRNLRARGYKIGLRAMDVEGLVIENADLSYNYRKKLNSTQEKEDISDWMSYHQNEKDEWLRYGAAMYLRNCNNTTIRNCKVTGGQNALMMTACNDGKIYNNDFSFNSGIGVGLYRSSRNHIRNNKVNFNVRGYSHGVFNRGQDSAGFLVYEQSSENVFYKNSATHSGDGFFLWAGQTTMDNGVGGCNDNLIWYNDFSYAPTNGIEVTFSRNIIKYNRIFECDHGIWGGYSYETLITNNQFRNNRIAIAIEHGQKNEIAYNLFSKDKEAVKLWARKQQPEDWGYAKARDTRSMDYIIASNSFNSHQTVFFFQRTHGLKIYGNTVSESEVVFKVDSTVSGIDSLENPLNADPRDELQPYDPPGIIYLDPFKGQGKLAGRKNIMITEWGPYNFNYPMIWNINPVDSADEMKFLLLGPAGKWKIKKAAGVTGLSKQHGSFPDTITVKKINAERTDILIEVEYTGRAFTTIFGEPVTANKKHVFTFRKFFQPINWNVLWYAMDTSVHNPIRTGELFSPVERKRPVKEEKNTKLDYAWWGGIRSEDETHKQFFTVADGEASFEPGNYELSVTWDDAVRIYVDGNLVVNEWNPSLYKFDESPNRKSILKLGGKHVFRVEHVELGGFACLSLKFRRLP